MSPKKEKLDTDQVASELADSSYFQPASTQVGKPTKYTTIKAVKDFAYHHDMKDYEVVEAAILEFLKKRKEQKQNL
jgi:hypothetical protein